MSKETPTSLLESILARMNTVSLDGQRIKKISIEYSSGVKLSLAAENTQYDCITNLNLGVKARRAIHKLGITTISQIKELSDTDLLMVRNCGRTTVREIRRQVHLYQEE